MNVNVFMSVPVAADSAAVNVYGHSAAANYVDLRAQRDVLAVLSNQIVRKRTIPAMPTTDANPRDHLAAIAERQAVASLGRGERS